MKTLALLLVLFAQEVRLTEPNWAACYDYGVWEGQEAIRHTAPEKWFSFLRPLVAEGLCFVTRGGSPVAIVGSDSTGHAIQIITEDETLWWLSSEAVDP